MEAKNLELTAARSKTNDDLVTISHMERLVKDLERQVYSAEERRKAYGRFQFKQGRIEWLRTGSALGFERVFQTGYSEFS